MSWFTMFAAWGKAAFRESMEGKTSSEHSATMIHGQGRRA